jgi:hypothetical protein
MLCREGNGIDGVVSSVQAEVGATRTSAVGLAPLTIRLIKFSHNGACGRVIPRPVQGAVRILQLVGPIAKNSNRGGIPLRNCIVADGCDARLSADRRPRSASDAIRPDSGGNRETPRRKR